MPARRTVRWAVSGAAALVLSCVTLAGCGSSGGSSPTAASAPSSGGSSPPAGHVSAHSGKLTGNFCTDFKNIGTNMPIPAVNSGSASAMEQHDGTYLNQLSGYYTRLAAEAPPQAGRQIRHIVSAYQGLASSIVNGSSSLSQIEQQIGSLTSTGTAAQAFKKLVIYVTTKCS